MPTQAFVLKRTQRAADRLKVMVSRVTQTRNSLAKCAVARHRVLGTLNWASACSSNATTRALSAVVPPATSASPAIKTLTRLSQLRTLARAGRDSTASSRVTPTCAPRATPPARPAPPLPAAQVATNTPHSSVSPVHAIAATTGTTQPVCGAQQPALAVLVQIPALPALSTIRSKELSASAEMATC